MSKYTGLGMSEHTDDLHTNVTRKVWIDNVTRHTGGEVSSLGIRLDSGVDDYVVYQYIIPEDYVSGENLYVHYCAATNELSGDVEFSYTIKAGHPDGSLYSAVTNEDLNNAVDIANNDQYKRRKILTAGLLDDLEPGMICQLIVDRCGSGDFYSGDVFVSGYELEYEARQ